MTTPTEICERLRNPTMEERYDGMVLNSSTTSHTMAQAAELITAQAEEIKRLNGAFRFTCAELQGQITRAEAAEAALEKMREVLDEALVTLKHARVFIGGREKMHPDGQALFDECINKIDATLQGGGE